jgi:hypothetical protein
MLGEVTPWLTQALSAFLSANSSGSELLVHCRVASVVLGAERDIHDLEHAMPSRRPFATKEPTRGTLQLSAHLSRNGSAPGIPVIPITCRSAPAVYG